MSKQHYLFGSAPKPYFTEEQISEQQKPYTATLLCRFGDVYKITMPLCLWDWLLITTHVTKNEHQTMTPTCYLERVLSWKKKNNSEESISDLMALFVAEMVRWPYEIAKEKNSDFDYTHERVMVYLKDKSYSCYDQVKDLHWRIDGEKVYPIPPPPYPRNPAILDV